MYLTIIEEDEALLSPAKDNLLKSLMVKPTFKELRTTSKSFIDTS